MTYSGLYLRADEKIFKLQICISEWINVLSFCFVHILSEQRSTRKRIQHWVKQPQFCIKFNGEEHLNRFSCNFFRQFKYTIAGVLPIVRYTFSALWQMNSRNFLQVKRHLIERLWEPEKKKKSNKELCHKQFQVAPEQVEEDVDEQLFLLEPMVPGLLHSATERKNAINIKVGKG